MFLTNHDGLNKFSKGSPKKHSWQIIFKLVQWFLTKRFIKFSTKIYNENKLPPPPFLMAMFLTNHDSLKNLGRGKFLPYYIEIGSVVSDKKIIKVIYIDIWGN